MKALIVGASAGVGRALSEQLAAKGSSLLLVASDARDLQAQAAHLHLLYGVQVETVMADASQPSNCLSSIQSNVERFGPIDGLFFPIGVSRSDDQGTLPLDESQQLLNANLVIVMGIIENFLPALLNANNGHIVGFGSVAAIRGRRNNVVYAAAKRGLESYFESLFHITSSTGIHVQFYKLGYVATQQSFGKHLLFPRVEPQVVAAEVVRNLYSNRRLIYFPRYWSIIAELISAIPWAIFKRLDF